MEISEILRIRMAGLRAVRDFSPNRSRGITDFAAISWARYPSIAFLVSLMLGLLGYL